ncbi:hypothetical protein [Streptomyces sp. CB01883]|nr:hypothetical protein [Streptomyces sp. CB01883]
MTRGLLQLACGARLPSWQASQSALPTRAEARNTDGAAASSTPPPLCT